MHRVARINQNSTVSCFPLIFVVVLVVIVANTQALTLHAGYIPDNHGLRSRCFVLMTTMSTLHNLNRSIGCALLVASDETLLLSFAGGEMMLYLVWKVFRKDFMYWFRVEGFLGAIGSFLIRVIAKVIVDFSGCLQLR